MNKPVVFIIFIVIFELSYGLYSPFAFANDGTQKWTFETGTFILSSPAIGSDGTIYVGSKDKNLYALNPDGTQKWAFKTGDTICSSSAIGLDGTIYVGSDDSNLYAINPDGTQKWVFYKNGSKYSSPAVGSDGTIYVGSDDSNVYAINPDGTQKWAFNTGGVISSNTSPAIGFDGTIYIGSTQFYAINPDGTQKWAGYPSGGYLYGSAVINSDGTIYVEGGYNLLRAIDSAGTQKWTFSVGIASNSTIGPNGTIYFGSSNKLIALNPGGTEKWEFYTGDYVSLSPAIGSDGTIYFGSDNKLYALNSDGTEKWMFNLPGKVSSSPTIGLDGTIYLGYGGKGGWGLSAINSSSAGPANSIWPIFGGNAKHTHNVVDNGSDNFDKDLVSVPTNQTISVSINGTTVDLAWSADNADTFTLYVLKYPLVDEDFSDDILPFDMGTKTSLSLKLTNGDAFFVGAKAFNNMGGSWLLQYRIFSY